MPTKRTTPELSSHLGYWLRFVSNHVSHAFALKVENLGVTVAEWVVLRQLLAAEPAAPSRLADLMGVTRGTVSKLVDRLIAKELVARENNASDRRAHVLRLTPAGRTIIPRLAKLADRNDAEFFGHLSAVERRALLKTLRAMAEHHELASLPVD